MALREQREGRTRLAMDHQTRVQPAHAKRLHVWPNAPFVSKEGLPPGGGARWQLEPRSVHIVIHMRTALRVGKQSDFYCTVSTLFVMYLWAVC